MASEDPSTVVGVRWTDDDSPGDRPTCLALTIVWHRDVRRIGGMGLLRESAETRVSRKTAPFDAASDVMLSRDPFLTVVDRGGTVELRPHRGKPTVEVEGRPLDRPHELFEKEARQGTILLLARELVVCLHRVELPFERGPSFDIVGVGDAIEGVRRQIARAADLDASVLIRGETGAGKELVALAIRNASPRRAGPFVKVSMADIPAQTAAAELFGYEKGAFTGAVHAHPDYFVQANGGTLFLDEIALAAPDVQKMLLRVLETGEVRPLGSERSRQVDVRVIAATDENLEEAASEGRFREPLLHRLAGYQIPLPPLRERREDIGPLFLNFLRKELAEIDDEDSLQPRALSERPWLDAADVARIACNSFPGNVRMLRNIARQLVISNRGEPHIRIDAVVDHMLSSNDAGEGTEEDVPNATRPAKVTDDDIREALERHKFNFSAAAAALGIHRSTLYERVRQNPQGIRSASELSDVEILASHARHNGDVAAMASELRVSPKPLAARLKETLARVGRE